ncbi:hypothetical protein F2Q69_00004553 [Brassica cretica]|uniref:Uncharacterized protein n=1 Tax=Brassica cretica TaxID=69181 RepID=A0A8S9NUN4_BRACR|nr:hypothetical protein F2Q69_00004553 [Brassica cretica]
MAATKIVFHHMVLISHSFKGFSDLEDFWARRLPDDFQEVFCGVLIRWVSSSTWICFTDLGLIYMFFISGSNFGRLMGSLLRSLLKYNALEDFHEVFQTTSRKYSDGVFFHIKWSLSLSL